ncbi:MAG: replication protein RepA [Theionarchaea archaeon]|nr:replication protein RepA [Theionarchaea archaeon]
MKKRAPSQRMRLDEIHQGTFVTAEEDFELNYLIATDARKVYRAKVVATIVSDPYISDDSAYGRITLDDGFDTISGAVFREQTALLEDVELGQLVQVMGKIREWKGEKQLTLEAISPVHPNFMLLHRIEILTAHKEHARLLETAQKIYEQHPDLRSAKDQAREKGVPTDIIEALDELRYLEEHQEEEEEPVVSKSETVKMKVLSFIESNGEGVDMDKILAAFADTYTTEEIEDAIKDLLSIGEIFERKINFFAKA